MMRGQENINIRNAETLHKVAERNEYWTPVVPTLLCFITSLGLP